MSEWDIESQLKETNEESAARHLEMYLALTAHTVQPCERMIVVQHGARTVQFCERGKDY